MQALSLNTDLRDGELRRQTDAWSMVRPTDGKADPRMKRRIDVMFLGLRVCETLLIKHPPWSRRQIRGSALPSVGRNDLRENVTARQ